ncbi:hypothetical protein LPJ53_000386 [Coemansia erecta]|uniref:C2H2-type domain-containing protein n=1 Tax=Coemansia erecta TaxID=147472 RepID=A0A9W8CV78_9FUNG|nr:hypothetical protein LPJ53_000386 [Coemansia erecta]
MHSNVDPRRITTTSTSAKESASSRPHRCPYPNCAKGFKHLKNLQRHQLTHTGERAHTCDECGMRFARKDKLQRHMETHSDERPFACDVCHLGFKRRSALKRHSAVHR